MPSRLMRISVLALFLGAALAATFLQTTPQEARRTFSVQAEMLDETRTLVRAAGRESTLNQGLNKPITRLSGASGTRHSTFK